MNEIRINAYRGDYAIDLAGKRFGMLTVQDFSVIRPGKPLKWLCVCDCGFWFFASPESIVTKPYCGTCGQWHSWGWRTIYFWHPYFQKLAALFASMKHRCYNPNSKGYPTYGERGIGICEEWLGHRDSFIAWALDNGYRPGLTIDRKDNYLGYTPSNSRFVTMAENLKNMRRHQDQGLGVAPPHIQH